MADGTSDTHDPALDAAEPSMEDILASIRQLIAHDEDGGGAAVSAETAAEPSEGDPLELVDIIDNDEEIEIPDMPAVQLVEENIEALDQAADDVVSLDVPDVDMDVMAAPVDLDIPSPNDALQDDTPKDEFSLDGFLDDTLGIDAELATADLPSETVMSEEAVTAEDKSGLVAGALAAAPIAAAPIVAAMAIDNGAGDTDAGDDDIGDLIHELTADLDIETSEAEIAVEDATLTELEELASETPEIMDEETASEPVAETITSEPVDELVADADIAAVDTTSESGDVSDPDLELVKSLMAELTGESTAEAVDSGLENISIAADLADSGAVEDVAIDSLDLEAPAQTDEGELLDDLIGDLMQDDASGGEAATIEPALDDVPEIVAEVTAPQEDVDIAAEMMDEPLGYDLEADNSPSALSALADEIEAGATPQVETEEGISLGAIAAAGGVATAAVAAPKLSALESLLGGVDEEAQDNINMDVGAANLSLESALTDDDNVDFDNIVTDLVSDPESSSSDNDLGAALEALLDDTPYEADLGAEIEVPEQDVIDEIIATKTDSVIDQDTEIVEVKIDNSKTETEDMAGKAAQNKILDEVTETAAASAFASLNQVVEEKNIIEERGDRIGDLVTEALQPMLKEWLDKNLKTIVERAVTKEVKRISSGK